MNPAYRLNGKATVLADRGGVPHVGNNAEAQTRRESLSSLSAFTLGFDESTPLLR